MLREVGKRNLGVGTGRWKTTQLRPQLLIMNWLQQLTFAMSGRAWLQQLTRNLMLIVTMTRKTMAFGAGLVEAGREFIVVHLQLQAVRSTSREATCGDIILWLGGTSCGTRPVAAGWLPARTVL